MELEAHARLLQEGPSSTLCSFSPLADPIQSQSESYTSPGPNNRGVKRVDVPSVHGHAKLGVSASYPPFLSKQFTGFFKGLRELGVPVDQDLSDGQGEGVSFSASSMDPITRTRETSDTAYSEFAEWSCRGRTLGAFAARSLGHLADAALSLSQVVPIVAGRTNLVVLTSAQATKLTWASKKSGSNVVASGVNFVATAKNSTTLHVVSTCASLQKYPSLPRPRRPPTRRSSFRPVQSRRLSFSSSLVVSIDFLLAFLRLS